MNNVKNEQGYALVTVLLIVTVFTVFFLSFMGQAFSSVKQNKVVEKSSQSVAIAEMGVAYYQVAIQGIFEKAKSDAEKEVTENRITTESDVIKFLRKRFEDEIKLIAPPLTPIDENGTFSINKDPGEIIVNATEHDIKIELTVKGDKNGEPTELYPDMVISNLSSIVLPKSSLDFFTTPEIMFNKVKEPKNLDGICTKPSSIAEINNCSEVIISEPKTGKTFEVKNDLTADKIYSKVDLILDGNLNSTNKKSDGTQDVTEIFAKSLVLGGNFNKGNNIVIETQQDLSIDKNMQNLDNSTLYIGGHLLSSGQFNINNSHVFIKGVNDGNHISTISKQLTIDGSSSMCVNGDLKVDLKNNQLSNNINGKIYIKGTLLGTDNVVLSYPNHIIPIDDTNKHTYKVECGTTFDSISWGDVTNTNIDIVDYD
jgi:hypothetical protein